MLSASVLSLGKCDLYNEFGCLGILGLGEVVDRIFLYLFDIDLTLFCSLWG